MVKEKKLPRCVVATDKKTGAKHNICARVNKDRGDIVIVDEYRNRHKIMSNLKEVLDHSRENFKSKDVSRIGKMSTKSFRLAKKSSREISGGASYSKFGIFGKREDSSSV
ncbi:MAG: hypothetical protein AABX28_03655 [Nanoarchaeota archaeon]